MGERKKKGMVEVRERKRGVERCSDPHESRSSPSSREGGHTKLRHRAAACMLIFVCDHSVHLSLSLSPSSS